MATRADVVRQSLHDSIDPNPASFIYILLRPETWQVVLWAVDELGGLLQRSEDPRMRFAGQQVRAAVRYANGEAHMFLAIEPEPQVVSVDKQSLLLQIQMLQQQLDLMEEDIDADPKDRMRLEIKIETLLEVLANNVKGTHA